MNNSELLIYQAADGRIKLDVRLEDETVWLSQDQMAELFGKSKKTISEHIRNIFQEGELIENLVVRKFRITTRHGAIAGKTQSRDVLFYNLDVIISVGYRVKSHQGTQFRIWATQRLREYIVKGFVLNDERFKSGHAMNYFTELQERIREIRLWERFFYQKIKDIYATSIDYDPDVEVTHQDGYGCVRHLKVWLLDLETIDNNDWVALNQYTVIEDNRNRRADVVVLFNGLPLTILELKNPGDENATINSPSIFECGRLTR